MEFFGDEIDRISEFQPPHRHGEPGAEPCGHLPRQPLCHHQGEDGEGHSGQIQTELEDQVKYFNDNDMLVEAQRIRQRTEYDMEMMRELGYCSGIENYSRIISDRPAGQRPYDPAGLSFPTIFCCLWTRAM